MTGTETEYLACAEEAARAAGRVLAEWSSKFTAREKSRANLVTEADFAAQETIHSLIHRRFPEHNFLGEEGLSQTNSDSRLRWLIDPLDGTANYVHRFPYYAVSIALEDANGLLVGVIYDPTRDELYSAVRGQGAKQDGSALAVSANERLSDAMVMGSLPVGVSRDHPAIEHFCRVLTRVQHLQRTGSAALNLAAVACGRIDAFWSVSLHPWDMAAGVLLVTEAGGKVTTTSRGPFQLDQPDLLASNGSALHADLSEILS